MDNQSKKYWHAMPIIEVYAKTATSAEGLTDEEAARRLTEQGANELRKGKKRSVREMLLEQLKDPMILILFAAATLSFILGEVLEGGVILFIVAVNAIISIVQEKKAEASLDALKKMTVGKAIALRNGEESEIPSSELVVGDIVFLEDGSLVPADIRLVESANLKTQEASLTGETLSCDKEEEDLHEISCSLGDRSNMVYSSTLITYGRGYGVVVATGMNTEVGQIARLIDEQDELDTPLKRKLASVGKVLTIVGLIISVLIFIIGFLYQQPWVPLLMTAISLAISIIPEGLPATATIVLALGVQRMAKRGAIIRKLPAVETLGSATVICSDKTGTLTMNQMTVTRLAGPSDWKSKDGREVEEAFQEKDAYRALIQCGMLCNNADFDPDDSSKILGDPTEGALLVLGCKFGEDEDNIKERFPRQFEQPFDSDRKRMSTINKVDEKLMVSTKGALEQVLSVCTFIQMPEGVRRLEKDDEKRLAAISEQLSSDALRVLAFAQKEISEVPVDDEEDIEFDLTFIGMVGMIDPPRKEVKRAVQSCYRAGIRTIMITGDHKGTALAIAKELSIWRAGDTVYSGAELEQMSEEKWKKAVQTTSVYARVTPKQKLDIVQALRENKEIAAMLGDGVNDAPALKAADISVAMGVSGTDVAKEASDMVITDDNFTTVVEAVKEGRRVYRNIQKVIQFLLAGNISEILTIFIAILFNFPAPLLAVQILWVNLATDTLPALALGVDPAEKDVMEQPPVKSGSFFEKGLVRRVILQGSLIAAVVLVAFFIGLRDDVASGQGMAFCTIAFSQLLYSYSQRSNTKTIFSKGFFANKYLFGAIVLSAVLIFALLLVPPAREMFQLSAIEGDEWLIIGVLSFVPMLLIEGIKGIKNLFYKLKKKTL